MERRGKREAIQPAGLCLKRVLGSAVNIDNQEIEFASCRMLDPGAHRQSRTPSRRYSPLGAASKRIWTRNLQGGQESAAAYPESRPRGLSFVASEAFPMRYTVRYCHGWWAGGRVDGWTGGLDGGLGFGWPVARPGGGVLCLTFLVPHHHAT